MKLFAILSLIVAMVGQAATVGSLRCEFLENPQGIDAYEPRLSWIQESTARGAKQTASQVMVASSTAALDSDTPDLWDSGKVESDQSIHIRYAGKKLESRQVCFWKVRIWDKDGKASAWSEAARWSMGLKDADWQGKWIGKDTPVAMPPLRDASWIACPADDKQTVKRHCFRRSFELPADRRIRSGEFYLGVNGSFGSAVNGVSHGSGAGFHEATMVDIAPHLKAGRNTIALWVETDANSPRKEPSLTGRVEIHFETGPSLIFAADETWLTSPVETEAWVQPDAIESAWKPAARLGPAGMAPFGETLLPASRELPARLLRKEFTVPSKPVRAMLYLSGQGISECEMNGGKISNHVLSPALTEYDKRVVYVTHDVTNTIVTGQNAIGVHLGNGRFHAPRSKWFVMTRDYGVPRLMLQLELEFADGTRQIIASDASWKATDHGPIRANNEYDGEVYDARLEQKDWSAAGFSDSSWQPADILDAPGGKLVAQMMHPIRVTETLKPIAMTEPSPGKYVFDMGQNMVGWCQLKVKGSQGAEIKLRHAETLRDDGNLYLANMRGAAVTDVYYLRGGDLETYEPRFTYHGFRFVEVTGFPGKPTLDSISGRVVHDDLPSAGDFECSEPLINQFHSNIRWGVRGNYRSIPTDCPQRDERQAWLGDRTFSTRGETYLFDTATFYAKWLQDMADAQKQSGSIPDVCPSYWPLYNDNVAWPSAAIVIPDTMLDQYADTALIARHYPAMVKWMTHMSQFIEDDLIAKDNYGDWCVPPEDPELIHSVDLGRKTHPTLIATSYFCHDLDLMGRYAKLLGKTQDETRYRDLSMRMAAAMNRKFYDTTKGYYDNGSQTSCVLPLAFGLVPEPERSRVFDHLVGKITGEARGHIATGLVGGQWLNRVLTEGGRPDLVKNFATHTDYPSWGYMIKQGATTVWELWNGNTANPAMNSGNHVMLVGDFMIWLYESLAGIKSDSAEPGFKHIIMKPEPVDGITFARASHRSPFGEIRSEWKRQGPQFEWKITVPPNCRATAYLPCRDQATLRESGQVISASAGVKMVTMKEGRAVLELAAGSYHFLSQ